MLKQPYTKTIFITGGAGFIGSALVRHLIRLNNYKVINIDKLTYSGNLESLKSVQDHPNYVFIKEDITHVREITSLFFEYKPTGIIHLAAESHVDRSIDSPRDFIVTNVLGTYSLLESARTYWNSLAEPEKSKFRFHHVSTDEVFGSLGAEGFFTEKTAYDPRSPYSASKASSDHLVRAWLHTYGLPCLITNCSNNYGPFHFPEKLIPHMIINMLMGKNLPVYGKGNNVRDWIYVEDHVRALELVFSQGKVGETYAIGGNSEQRNIDVVHLLCEIMDRIHPRQDKRSYRELIQFVSDRPGHDFRYAINSENIHRELGWSPQESFAMGLEKTVRWYLENKEWWQNILNGSYKVERLGLETTQTNHASHPN